MRLRDLTIADLTQTPLWRHEGGDDETAEVFPAAGFADVDQLGYIAATKCITADGTEFLGFCSPQDPSGMDYIRPVIVTAHGHVRLWCDSPVADHEIDAMLAPIAKKREQVFPLKCNCLVPFEGEVFSARISGFNMMAKQTDEPEPFGRCGIS
jgi:hypothetical protein